MTARHRFGGNWTEEKLEMLRKYLAAYMKIFTRNERARFFHTVYVDAFAGSGYRSLPEESTMFDELLGEEPQQFLAGSARIALNLPEPFNEYLFIEKNQHRAQQLTDLCNEFPQCRIVIKQGDANEALSDWLQTVDWKKLAQLSFSILMECRSNGIC